jgi:tRNA pseudouridine32 synthase / 23S rRNA pseudouridine746 synthase
MSKDPCFHAFKSDISTLSLPEKFTFPFNYDPHSIAILACDEIKNQYLIPNVWNHDFGFTNIGMGKMFGVLVVKDKDGKIGFLSAFSGKIGETNKYEGFVPPVFDILEIEGFFKQGEAEILKINDEIEVLLTDPSYLELTDEVIAAKRDSEKAIAELKIIQKENKESRKHKRTFIQSIDANYEDKEILLQALNKESSYDHYRMKDLRKIWLDKINSLETTLAEKQNYIQSLKTIRRQKSAILQKKIFASYRFINSLGEWKDVIDIFHLKDEVVPPSGAGECAAPKLIQYAFLQGYKLIAMAEFWWGRSPASEIRKHEYYYPACKGKCEPILSHMLQGIEMDTNPVLLIKQNLSLDIIYEDDDIMAINKPHNTLSVTGKLIEESLYDSLKEILPNATGPLNIHRLDMGTSGVMLIAKNIEAYHFIQYQFIKRRISKTYIAVLEGVVESEEGIIDLPLRLDIDDRPRQLVCYEHGKPAQTKYKVISKTENETRIQFNPITGRTHQLRVHASHNLGLNCSIKGDELYGKRSDRLYLHAASITFKHPSSLEIMTIHAEVPF